VDLFLNWINKIIFPIVQLQNEEEVDKFFDLSQEWQENTPFFKNSPYKAYGEDYDASNTKARVVIFMYDKEDFKDEVGIMRRTGRFSALRKDLRIGIVTDGKAIKRFKTRFGSLYFPEGAHTSIVLKRNDEKIFMYDLMASNGEPLNMNYWINRKSLGDVIEMTQSAFKVFELVRLPILIAFVDFEHEKKSIREASIKTVEILKKVAPSYYKGILFTYASNTDYKHTRKNLGITHNKIPAISINANEQKVTPFPSDKPLSKKNLHTWVDQFFKGDLVDKRDQFGDIVDFDIKYQLSSTLMLTRDMFRDKVFVEGTDYIVFTYTSAFEQDIQKILADTVNRYAEALENERIQSCVVASYDVNTENAPPMMEQNEVPMIYIFPAYQKSAPFKKFMGEPRASSLANFVEKNADVKFKLKTDLAMQESMREMQSKQASEEYQRKMEM